MVQLVSRPINALSIPSVLVSGLFGASGHHAQKFVGLGLALVRECVLMDISVGAILTREKNVRGYLLRAPQTEDGQNGDHGPVALSHVDRA